MGLMKVKRHFLLQFLITLKKLPEILELREKYEAKTKVPCFVSEKIVHILQSENKIRFSMFKSSIKKINQNFALDHEVEQIFDM